MEISDSWINCVTLHVTFRPFFHLKDVLQSFLPYSHENYYVFTRFSYKIVIHFLLARVLLN